ncbi:HlyD family efflux transporter periplasmic adaptor subunit [Actinoplanes sp. TRM 88003]|uniref:HlyD family efflux transporter periplasmic adaptor subunit n=1 Tax=Paractinoplanes aksuensis TaxID=2939490 RepID=A0ABT1DP51_9ACTN|nr:peptidoglycan-binding protein [Actinoplanes aksuensis]MCO8271851.1 HlyD family efflux transporter periplasmic adaptor subunit [Actinoplanes aksuensis]
MSYRKTITGALLVLALTGAAAFVLTQDREPGPAPVAEQTEQVATVKLERRDLSTTTSLSGQVGFGAARPLAGHVAGTVTWLPKVGATIEQGRQLFRADDAPVVLFYGKMPLYRPIATPLMSGRDVRIVADNLRALGYRVGPRPAGTPAGESVLTPGLVAAIKRWQRDLGRPVTGTVAVGEVEVQSGPVRVESLTVQPGAAAAADLMTVTSTRKLITVSAELADAAKLTAGSRVIVVLPDDRTIKARVSAVGRDATGNEGDAPRLTVSVTVDNPAGLAKLDSAEVKVNFPGRTAKKVLAVPIEALVALSEGGYAVQGPQGLVPVKAGLFADGWVQVSGAGLTEDMDVVVAS